jgi:capsular polysaccharide biosynthesis protein
MSMYGSKIGAEFVPVDSTCTLNHTLPKTVHATIRQQLSMDVEYECPPTFVITIPRGRMWDSGYIISPDDRLLDDVSVDFRAQRDTFSRTSSIRRYWKLRDVIDYNGRVAVLSTDGADIYYHWFFQLLPRYELLRRAGIDTGSIDYFVVNDLAKAFQQESIKALGIDPKKIIVSSKTPYLRARQLVVPSIPIGGGCYRPWICQFLRETFLSPVSGRRTTGRRIYISRGLAAYRRVLNETDVLNLLRSFGFEELKLEGLSMPQQAEVMASCAAVVGPHGAGLSNIVFCQPGTKVIEIFSPELVTGFFWKLASQVNLDYYYVLGKGPAESHEENYHQSWDARADITVDLMTLRKTLEMAGLAGNFT